MSKWYTLNERIDIVREKPVYDNKYGTLFDDEVAFPSGVRGNYLRFKWKSPFSVAILPIMYDKTVALVSCFRHAIREWSLEIPKGFGLPGQSPIENAARELHEEMGMTCEWIEVIGELFTEAGFIVNKTIICQAHGCRKIDNGMPEDEEAFGPGRRLTVGEIPVALEGINDAVTIVALQSYYMKMKE